MNFVEVCLCFIFILNRLKLNSLFNVLMHVVFVCWKRRKEDFLASKSSLEFTSCSTGLKINTIDLSPI